MEIINQKIKNIFEQIVILESQLKKIEERLNHGFILFDDNSVKGFHTNTDDFVFVENTLINLRKFILKKDYCSIYNLSNIFKKDSLGKLEQIKENIESILDEKFIYEMFPSMLNDFLNGVNENDRKFLLNLSTSEFLEIYFYGGFIHMNDDGMEKYEIKKRIEKIITNNPMVGNLISCSFALFIANFIDMLSIVKDIIKDDFKFL